MIPITEQESEFDLKHYLLTARLKNYTVYTYAMTLDASKIVEVITLPYNAFMASNIISSMIGDCKHLIIVICMMEDDAVPKIGTGQIIYIPVIHNTINIASKIIL